MNGRNAIAAARRLRHRPGAVYRLYNLSRNAIAAARRLRRVGRVKAMETDGVETPSQRLEGCDDYDEDAKCPRFDVETPSQRLEGCDKVSPPSSREARYVETPSQRLEGCDTVDSYRYIARHGCRNAIAAARRLRLPCNAGTIAHCGGRNAIAAARRLRLTHDYENGTVTESSKRHRSG